ncbi:hypothetical protein WJX75_002059 [Coccomyxa subellipsoidea]|uniref:Uncharacterized protein n=1 Tax=Coccomyxa subellipsoidea TaxID=248742 RepID=A0ABR2Z0V5_9CHLO
MKRIAHELTPHPASEDLTRARHWTHHSRFKVPGTSGVSLTPGQPHHLSCYMSQSLTFAPGDAGSPSTEQSEAHAQSALTLASLPQQLLEVSQYLSDDFLCEMGALPDFGLEEILPPPVSLQEAGKWPERQTHNTQQTSSNASWQDESELPRLPSPLNLEFPDFSDILGMELHGPEVRQSVSYTAPKEELLSCRPPSLPQREMCGSRSTLDSAGESTATQYHAHEHLPYATPRGSVDCSTPTARFSPLLAQPMTPVLLHPRTAVMHSPAVAERPVFEARHNHPDFATIYAFLGSLFDPACAHINHEDVLVQMAPVDPLTPASGLKQH